MSAAQQRVYRRAWQGGLFVFLPLLAACGGGSAGSPSTPTEPPADLAVVAMDVVGNHPIVTVELGGQQARLVVDTGANQHAITAALAARLGLPREGPARGQGAGGEYEAYWVSLPELRLGRAVQYQQRAFLVPFPEEFPYDGVLGASFLQSYVITLDYAGGVFRLQSPAAFRPAGAAIGLPLKSSEGMIAVPATVAGQAGDCLIDTGAGSALTVLRPAADRYGWRAAFSPRLRTVTGASPGGVTYGDLVRIPLLELGPYRFRQVLGELSLAESGWFAGNQYLCHLGGELWRRFRLTLDYPQQRLYLEPNGALDEPFVYARGGLVLGLREGRYRIVDIQADGPAQAAGLQVGDWVLAIESRSAGEWSTAALAALFRRPVGTPVRLRVADAAGQEREAVLILKDML